MSIPAGVQPPAPDQFADVGVVHAVDGDGTAFCLGDLSLEQVDSQSWRDAPVEQRCHNCELVLQALGA